MRVEKNDNIKDEMATMKQDVVTEIKKGNKIRHPKLTCAVIFLVIITSFFIWVAFSVAKTGLVNVPFFSKISSAEVVPTRVVAQTESLDAYVKRELNEIVLDKVKQAKAGKATDNTVNLEITEGVLTGALREQLAESAGETFDAARAQVAVGPRGGIEVFLPFKDNAKNSALLINLRPDIGEDGALVVEDISMQIGSFKVPSWLANISIAPVARVGVERINELLKKYAQLKSVSVLNGVMIVNGVLSVEVLEL